MISQILRRLFGGQLIWARRVAVVDGPNPSGRAGAPSVAPEPDDDVPEASPTCPLCDAPKALDAETCPECVLRVW